MQDGFDAPPAPNDFPPDTVIHHHVLGWLILLVFAVAAACAFTLLFKNAERQVRTRLGGHIDARVQKVRDALETAARARSADQFDAARNARAAIAAQFGRTLALGAELGKTVEGLNKALEGLREEDPKPKPHRHPGESVAAGGTVINISVGGHATPDAPKPDHAGPEHAGPEHAGHEKPDAPGPLTADEHSDLLWRAVQKLFAYWNNLHVIASAFTAAQQQLLHSAPWRTPQPDLPPAEASPRGFWRRPDALPRRGSRGPAA
jgi:hypothetical protein